MGVITWAVWASLTTIPNQIVKVHPDGHSEIWPSEFSVHQKTTRESPEFPDKVISGHIFRCLDRLGVRITSLCSCALTSI